METILLNERTTAYIGSQLGSKNIQIYLDKIEIDDLQTEIVVCVTVWLGLYLQTNLQTIAITKKGAQIPC